MVSYNTKVLDIYSPAEVEKAKNLSVYDSLDADVMQSYLEYSLASMIYYCLKVRAILHGLCSKTFPLPNDQLYLNTFPVFQFRREPAPNSLPG